MDIRGREEEAEKTLLNLRGPQYMMKAELEELKNILTSQQESAEAGFINKLKELKSREVYFPVLMMMLMFALQVMPLVLRNFVIEGVACQPPSS